MTRTLATRLSLARRIPLCLGQVLCGLSGERHCGTEGPQELFTLAEAAAEATALSPNPPGKTSTALHFKHEALGP